MNNLPRMDKKGFIFLPLAVLIILAVGLVVFVFGTGIALFASASFKIFAAGMVLIALSLIYGFKTDWNKQKSKVVITFVVLGVFMVLFSGSGLVQTGFTGSTFVNPDWARLECTNSESFSASYVKFLDEDNSFTCDAFTEECRIKYEYVDSPTFSCKNIKIFLDGNPTFFAPNVYFTFKAGQTVSFEDQFCLSGVKDFPYIKATQEWDPWGLYRYVGGSKQVVNSKNCNILESDKVKITLGDIEKTEYPGSKLYRTGGEGTKWINYVNTWNYGPATNVFTHPTYGKVYCNAATLYSIKTLTLADGTLKELNPTYQDTKEDGTTVSGMGSRLTNVQCCPNEPNCGDDFKFKPTTPPCFSDAQCTNAGQPIALTQTSYQYYTCESSKCVLKGPVNVECTTNAGCSTGQICDLSRTNYGKCITQVGQDYCGDNKCSITENAETCPKDCANNQCSWYQESYTRTEKDYGTMYWRALTGNPIVTETDDCRTAGWVNLLAVIVVITILGTILIFVWKPTKRGRRR